MSAPTEAATDDDPADPGGTVAPSGSAPEVERLGRSGRTVRVLLTVLGVGVLIAGSLFGQDDDFPFGPFRMYSTTAALNEPVRDTRVTAVDTTGSRLVLTAAATGFRRAEVEGELDRFEAQPQLLSALAEAYARRHPGLPRLVRIDVVVRLHALRDGRPTGRYTDRTAVSWQAAGVTR